MARDALTRNLRDGQLVISDGTGTPETLTLTLDEGNLRWSVTREKIEIKDRGTLDHRRPGDQMSCECSFDAKWVQLIGGSVSGSNTNELYELMLNTGDTYTSVADAGEAYAVELEFTVTAPGGVSGNSETITFAEFAPDSVECSEGNEYNLISVRGTDFETEPTIARA